jgi:adenylate cyclase
MTTHRKLAAIFSADAAGNSRLMADDEAATLRSLNDARALFRERIEAHGGRLIDTAGDSVFAEFPSAVEAVDCANEIQHELAKRNGQLA